MLDDDKRSKTLLRIRADSRPIIELDGEVDKVHGEGTQVNSISF